MCSLFIHHGNNIPIYCEGAKKVTQDRAGSHEAKRKNRICNFRVSDCVSDDPKV